MPPIVAVRHKRRWVARALLLFALLGVGLWLARGPLLGPTVARVISGVLADITGGQAHIDHASGGWLGDAELTGVAVQASGAQPWWSVQAQDVEVDYGIRLLRGDVSAVRSVRVDGLAVMLDLDLQPATAGPVASEPVASKPVASKPVASEPVPWPGVIAHLPLRLPLVTVTGDISLRSAGHHLHLTGVQVEGAGDHLTVAVQQLAINGQAWPLPHLSLVRSAQDSFSLQQPLTIHLPGVFPVEQVVQCDHFTVVLGSTSQQIVADGRVAGGTWHAELSATAMSLSVRGIDVMALGLLPTHKGHLLVDAHLERQAGGWLVRDIRAKGLGVTLEAQATLQSDPWRFSSLTAQATCDLSTLKEFVPALAELQGTLHAELVGELLLSRERWSHSALSVSVKGDSVRWHDQACSPATLEAAVAGGRIELKALDFGWKSLRATMVPAAAANAAPATNPVNADALPMETVLPGGWQLHARPIAIAGGTMTVRAQGGSGQELDGDIQLTGLPLAELISYTGLRHLQGSVAGNLHLGGTVQDPQWMGAVTVENLEAKLSPDIPTLTAGSAQVTLAARVLTLVNFQSDLGGAWLSAQGRILLDGGDKALALTCHGRNVLVVQRHDARVRADLDLRLNGSFKSPLLLGEVTITSALLTPQLLLNGGVGSDVPRVVEADDRVVLFEFTDPPLSRLRFDVHVGSVTGPSNTVKTVGSDSGLRIVTRWGRGLCDVDLHLGGTGAAPAPNGRLSVREGVVTLPLSTLAMTHGELLFPPNDPFQPRITATATARIRRYDVQIQVTGTVQNPIIRASGSGLDEQEALMLLTTGSTPRELQDETGRMAALGRLGGWLGQETWRTIEGDADPEAGPSMTDRLSIEWGRESSAEGRDTIDAEVELTNPGSRPAVLMTGERDRYEQYNGGFTLRWYWGGEDP